MAALAVYLVVADVPPAEGLRRAPDMAHKSQECCKPRDPAKQPSQDTAVRQRQQGMLSAFAIG